MRATVDETACTGARNAMVTARRGEHELLVAVADLETRANGRPWYTPPRWIDPRQHPRPGGRFPLLQPA